MFNLLPPPLKRQDAFCIKNVNIEYDNEIDYLEMNFGEMSNEMSNEINFDEIIYKGVPNLKIPIVPRVPKKSSSFETRTIIKKNKFPTIRRIYSI